MTTADQRYGSALWYAWGRIDSGQYQGTMDTDDGFRFAEEQRDAQQAYNDQSADGKSASLVSIIEAWSQYVERKRYALADKDASLGVGHVWYLVDCPAYRTLNPADCTCKSKS